MQTLDAPKLDDLIMPDLAPFEKPDDGKENRAHYINPPGNTHIWQPGMTAAEIVEIARATGQEVVMLCGFRKVPNYDPQDLEMCQECMTLAGQYISEDEG